ncbi:hypothetical protein A2Z33_00775 [Candidatus Gottesmanbacteria bacterium RBG_16_52_11]|uniref:Putative gluconeogenesis factor n=1 Tax=Candidatus Gottesmanbacteria bacterium RBG_16_52_11 TaxID=1798374 RepID=A0A1F5YNU0_9BACT|nr:MAG: hypothetical protein A2Z33_00775 [Candidatus Gottesmanbacteria bacterium RBG_16_52_11]
MKNGSSLKRVVCIGGGTGTFVVLRGLKDHPLNLKSIVAMSDSGGSNKRIRDEFGLLPTSDIRQCLVALSDESGGAGLMRQLFMYRFDKGKGISGMTFGNLFMAALADILGSQEEAIRATAKVLRIKGNVLPVTLTDTNLYAVYEDGHILTEEHLIDEPQHDGRMKIIKTYLKPAASVNPRAVKAILEADMVVIGPGDLYTSLIPNLLVDGIPQALAKTGAKVVYVLNLMTKYGQTYGFRASDHLNVLWSYIGRTIDTVIVNTGPMAAEIVRHYKTEHEEVVRDDLNGVSSYHVVREDVISPQIVSRSKSDTLVRSLIRHDSDKLAELLMKILNNEV